MMAIVHFWLNYGKPDIPYFPKIFPAFRAMSPDIKFCPWIASVPELAYPQISYKARNKLKFGFFTHDVAFT